MSQWFTDLMSAAEQTIAEQSGAQQNAAQQSLAKLKESGWPDRKREAWRFTPLSVFNERPLALAQTATVETCHAAPIIGVESIDIVFNNGLLATDLTQLALPQGLNIYALNDKDAAAQAVADALLAHIKPTNHVFGLVNDIYAQQGLIIDVAPGATIDKPVRIVTQGDDGTDGFIRVLCRVGSGAKAAVIEQNEGQQAALTNLVSEYDVGDEATLEHYRFALTTEQALNVGSLHVRLHDKSELNSTLVAFGCDLARVDVDIEHAGEFAFAKFNAVYLLDDGELFDLHSNIEHAMPNGTSEENVRGIVGDRSRAVFNGRIHIHRDAQKTLAEMNNRNLLLSRRAVINAKPELEIYADDVKCAHGATVAEIAEKELYYLLSRGIQRSQALVMLNYGFVQELINQLPNEALTTWLSDRLRTRFKTMVAK